MLLTGSLLAPPGAAHTRLRAVVATDPAPPVAARPCTVRVSFVRSDGTAAALPGWRVALRAEMRAHPMPPVEAALAPDASATVWVAPVTWSMAGTWEVTIEAAGGHDRVAGTMRLVVAAEPTRVPSAVASASHEREPRPPGEPPSVAMEPPDTALSWSPWAVLGGAVGLAALLETLAIGRAWRAGRRARRTEPQSPGAQRTTV